MGSAVGSIGLGDMIAIDRHLVVLGCGLMATAMLAYGGGLATAAWLGESARLCEPASPSAGDAGHAVTEPVRSETAAVTSQVDNPDGAGSAPVPGPRAPIAGAVFHVRVGSFLDQQTAGAIANRLAGRGYQASVEIHTDRTGVVWYAPEVGAYKEREIAVEAAREVAQRAGVGAHVVALAEDDAR